MEYLKSYSAETGPEQLCVSLETAHPAKFPEEIRKILVIDPILPSSLKGIDSMPEHFDQVENDYNNFKAYLESNFKK
jgi:threonine synthase